MLTMKHLRENIRKNLRLVTAHVADCVARDMTDINRYAEDFYCGLLNTAFGYKLWNLNRKKKNYPAIDLADDENGIGVQVTSTVTRAKVTNTLKKFFEGNLDDKYRHLILLVIGEEDKFRDPFRVERDFDFDPARDIWDTPTLIEKLENIEDIDTLKAVDEYLQKHLTIYRQDDQPLLNLPLRTAMDARNFVGREEELAQIAERFGRNEQIVVLSGLGGMGKTELAVRFGRDYANSGRGRAYFVSFRNDFFHTVTDEIAPGIKGLAEQKLDEDAKYAAVMEVLRKCGREDLLILDNADAEEESDFRDLCWNLKDLPLRTLLTTRRKAANALEIVALKPETLRQIFENYDVSDISTEDMDALIAAVNGHTMTVDLIARTLEESWGVVTPRDILNAMEHSTLPAEIYPEVYTDHNRDPEQRQIYAHLRSLFNLVNIPPEGKNALRCATLLPGGGMDAALFLKALPGECGKAIQRLEKQGWVRREKNILAIHPVVRLVCKSELKPGEEHCADFLNALWGQFDSKKHERIKFAQLAEVFANAMEIGGTPQTKAEWLNNSGRLWFDLMESRKCAALYKTYIPVLELHIPDHPALATAYNNVGSTYGALGDHAKALEYLLKALAIREKVLPPEHPDLAISYNNVGITYGALGDHAKALEYKLKALAIFEKVLPPEHPSLATSYNNVGSTYGALGDHAKALEYQQKALAIWEKVLPSDHPSLATSYNNVGSTYGELGEHAKELEYKLKALAIREKVLPPEHPSLAASYNNVGYTYGKLGNREKELEYNLKAFAIWEKVLPPTHPDLALSCNNLSWTYHKMGDYETALKLMRRAAVIAERSLPEGHPDRMQYRMFEMILEFASRQRRDSE